MIFLTKMCDLLLFLSPNGFLYLFFWVANYPALRKTRSIMPNFKSKCVFLFANLVFALQNIILFNRHKNTFFSNSHKTNLT
jgi:hypothetical protein